MRIAIPIDALHAAAATPEALAAELEVAVPPTAVGDLGGPALGAAVVALLEAAHAATTALAAEAAAAAAFLRHTAETARTADAALAGRS